MTDEKGALSLVTWVAAKIAQGNVEGRQTYTQLLTNTNAPKL